MIVILGAFAQDCDPDARLDAAATALSTFDLDQAAQRLKDAEADLECAAVTPEALGRLWMLDGIRRSLAGDAAGAQERFVAAKRTQSEPDFALYGGAVVDAWRAAVPPEGTVALTLTTPLGRAWIARVDGERVDTWPIERPAGLHHLQVLDREQVPHLSRFLITSAGEMARVDHGLPERPPEPVREPGVAWSLTGAIGAELTAGDRRELTLDGQARVEPGARFVVPVEIGLRGDLGAPWWRVTVHAGPLLGGSWLYAGEDGPQATSVGWGAEVAAGGRAAGLDLGVSAGARLPARGRVRAVLGVPLGADLRLEASPGAQFRTDGVLEPYGSLTLRYDFPL